MKRLTIIFLIGQLWSCTYNSVQEKKQTGESQVIKDTMLIQTVDSLPGQELERLLSIPTQQNFNEKYSGQYSYKLTSTRDKNLHGPFFVNYSDSNVYEEDIVSIINIRYSGQFYNGQKDGQFTEELLYNDGVDLYSKWTVTIDFKDDLCSSGTFTGAMGHIMSEKTYKFDNLDTCTFDFVVNLAWSEWEKEYKKH